MPYILYFPFWSLSILQLSFFKHLIVDNISSDSKILSTIEIPSQIEPIIKHLCEIDLSESTSIDLLNLFIFFLKLTERFLVTI